MPLWRLFGRTGRSTTADWWQAADVAAEALTRASVDRLRAGIAAAAPGDDDERREEMIDGLEQLLAVGTSDRLPAIDTRHRVIGTDACHVMAPVTLPDSPVAGKLFLTSARVVFASAGAKAWPWHRVSGVTRSDRDLIITIRGGEALHVRCNSYADALITAHVAKRLTGR